MIGYISWLEYKRYVILVFQFQHAFYSRYFEIFKSMFVQIENHVMHSKTVMLLR